MPSITIEYSTEAERLGIEQALAFFSQMRLVAATAPDGTVLAACEQVALGDGRRLLKDTLASAVQARADGVDAQKKPSRASATRGGTAAG